MAYKAAIIDLLKQLNPKMNIHTIENHLIAMAAMENYTCFGLFDESGIIGVASGWTTVRIYCGKQLEIDNVIIDQDQQSKGWGKYFINSIKEWSAENNFQTIGLNTYVENHPSHKFYYNQGFNIIGYHFENNLEA